MEIKKRLALFTDTDNRLVVAQGERAEEWMDWESGISRCKLLEVGWMNKLFHIAQGRIFNIL